jgi:transcriptional regulator
MYVPKHFAEPRIEVMHALMRARPLSTLVTVTPTGPFANHVPMSLATVPEPFGTLRGHVARSNPVWKDLSVEREVLAIFHGPESYISPSWYATKAENGRVVPTWNYVAVHAYGTSRAVDDPTWLRALVESLTNENETGSPSPWQVSDAPDEYIERQLAAIVGIEIAITRLEGKWKTSQNQPPRNRAAVVRALSDRDDTDAREMAALVAGHDPR